MSTCTVTISGSSVTLQEGSLQITSRVDDKDKATFTVIDSSGTLAFNRGQPVRITDSVQGLLFSGYINKPTATNLYPSATNMWSMDCVNKFVTAAKKAAKPTSSTGKRHKGGKHKNQHSGTIVANQIKEYVEPEGVTGNFGLDWTELQSDWQSGTLSGVVGAANTSTGNVGAGDLELAPAGNAVTFTAKTQADFQAGTLGGGLSSPSMGGLTFTPTQAIKLAASVGLAGISNASLKMKFWSGSYTIAAQDVIVWDEWIADSCPQQMASVDFVCTDGSVFTAAVNNGTDAQGVGSAITNDLSGLATNQWYHRQFFIDNGGAWVGKTISYVAVCFGGSSQGNYTAYFRNIGIYHFAGALKQSLFAATDTSTNVTPQPVTNNGYNAITCMVVTSYERHGFAYSPQYDLTNAALVNASQLQWNISLPNSNFAYSITASIDGFATFLPCTNQGSIPGLLPGMSLSGIKVQFVYVFNQTGNDPTLTPLLSLVQGTINPSYTCTKSDIVNTSKGATAWNAGTLTNLNLSPTNTIQLNGFARDWSDGNYANQTAFGTPSPGQGISNHQFFISLGSTGQANSRLDFAGNWQNFTMEVDVKVETNSKGGVCYRTTNWSNADANYAYAVEVSLTGVALQRGSNSSSSSPGTRTQIGSLSLTLSSGTYYRLKVVVNGSTHQIFLNDISLFTTTDNTYSAAGAISLRSAPAAAYTQLFANFGIMAALSGQWVSPAIDIHSLATISNSQIILQTDPAVNTSVTTLVEISLNNGSTWATCPNTFPTPVVLSEVYFQSLPVPGLTAGTNVSSLTQVKIRLTITSSTAATGLLMPNIQAVSLFVLGFYSSTGSRTNAPMVWDSVNRVPVVSGWGNASNGLSYTQVGTATTATNGSEATISNTTGDVHMVPNAPSEGDEDGSVRIQIAATMSAGIDLRYVDANNMYRLVITTTAITIYGRIYGNTFTFASSPVSLSPGSFYWLRFQVLGSNPTTFNGKVWLDGVSEPANWNVTYTL